MEKEHHLYTPPNKKQLGRQQMTISQQSSASKGPFSSFRVSFRDYDQDSKRPLVDKQNPALMWILQTLLTSEYIIYLHKLSTESTDWFSTK